MLRQFAKLNPKFSILASAFLILYANLSLANVIETEQGGVAFIPLNIKQENIPTVYFNNKRVLTIRKHGEWIAVVGVPIDYKLGDTNIKLEDNAEEKTLVFKVNGKKYPSESITIKDERKVSPLPKDLERIYKEKKQLDSIYANWESKVIDDLDFSLPVEGRISSDFGFKRIINNKSRNPHKGVDIAAPTGTPVLAASSGKVSLVGDLFFTGNTVVIDHGQGLQTIYCHLDKIKVQKGDLIQKKSVIGTVGQTGRATGPHLHFGVILNQAKVNPSYFMEY